MPDRGGSSRREFLGTCIATAAGVVVVGPTPAAAALPAAGNLLRRPTAANGVTDFSFFHVSDSHLDPRLSNAAYNPAGRSVETLAWIGRQSGQRIRQRRYGVTAEPPAFAIHTGDVFEYSLIDHTWQDLERAMASLACPLAPVPGNHDNTWGQINRKLRERFGGDSYSFDFGACHFICLNSAGFLDALPCWDRRTLGWLADDLSRVARETPVFLAMHHPLSGDAGYASPFDKLRFWNVVKDHHVVLIMDGHWHTVHRQQWQGIDRVNGGATFGPHTGYSSITVRDGKLRVEFNYEGAKPEQLHRGQVPLVEKSMLVNGEPRNYTVAPVVHERLSDGELLECAIEKNGESDIAAYAWIDDRTPAPVELVANGADLRAQLPTNGLLPGPHYATVRVRANQAPKLDFADEFWLEPPADAPYRVIQFRGSAGIKSRPLIVGESVVVGDTAGMVTALALDLTPKWTFATESQIVHSVAAADGLVLVGDVDGQIHALDARDGEIRWKRRLANAIYAAAAIADSVAIIADAAGEMHALQLDTGEVRWSQKIADFAFEAQPLLYDGFVYGGAWDGQVYAVDRHSGHTAWKAWSPSCQVEAKSRYYGAADVSPIVLGDELLVADRGWRLGRYSLDGRFLGVVRDEVVSIAASPSADSFYTRGLNHRLAKCAPSGDVIWEVEMPLGRAPTAPVEQNGRVAVVSDTGVLTVADASTGGKLFTLSISPGLFVLSGIGVDGDNRLFAADMDGRLTCMALNG